MKILDRLRCKHVYYKISEIRIPLERRTMSYILVYCPKCGKEKEMQKYKYDRMRAKEEIDRKYRLGRL